MNVRLLSKVSLGIPRTGMQYLPHKTLQDRSLSCCSNAKKPNSGREQLRIVHCPAEDTFVSDGESIGPILI
jgi:hypothetical protein